MLQWPYYNDQDARKRQIDTLKVFNENVVEIKESSEYRIDFTVNQKNMCLNVILSPDFPNEKPSIFVNPPVLHPWVAENSNQIVGAPGLLNFTIHSDLGRVVQAIIREFQKSVLNITVEVSSRSSEASPRSTVSAQSMLFPELNNFTIEELREILENTDLQVSSR